MDVKEIAEKWVDGMRTNERTLRLVKGCVTQYYLPFDRPTRTRLMEGNYAPLPELIKKADDLLFFKFWRIAGEILSQIFV